MKILLVAPANEALRVTAERKKSTGHRFFRFSMLSLLYVAAVTPNDCFVQIVDEQIEPIDFDVDVDVVGVTFMTALSHRAYEIGDEFMSRGVKVVFGGFHASFKPEEALNHADAVCIGEAETTWPELIRDIKNGVCRRIYIGDFNYDLSRVGKPERGLLKRGVYAPVEAVQVGRGCKHRCNFCSVTAFYQHTYRARPVEQVIRELSEIKNKRIIFVDDNIVADPDYAKRLFEALIPLKKKWISQASITIADDTELVSLAKQSGCVGLFIGIETLNEENLSLANKNINRGKTYAERIRIIHEHGIGIEAGIIFGLDKDKKEVFKRTLAFLIDQNIEAIQVSLLTPLPGTPLYDEMKEQGRIIDCNYDHYDYRHVVIEPHHMSPGELQAGADWVIRSFYSPWNIVKRVFRSIRSLGASNALTFCLGLNFAYVTRILQWNIKGYNPCELRTFNSMYRSVRRTIAKISREVLCLPNLQRIT
jgi:radical SAM superfamily enzyme YgiQ (UPF0313 family)